MRSSECGMRNGVGEFWRIEGVGQGGGMGGWGREGMGGWVFALVSGVALRANLGMFRS